VIATVWVAVVFTCTEPNGTALGVAVVAPAFPMATRPSNPMQTSAATRLATAVAYLLQDVPMIAPPGGVVNHVLAETGQLAGIY
jgi:hypothetical protein